MESHVKNVRAKTHAIITEDKYIFFYYNWFSWFHKVTENNNLILDAQLRLYKDSSLYFVQCNLFSRLYS